MPDITADAAEGTMTFDELASSPATPASGKGKIYLKNDGAFYAKNDAGTEFMLGSSFVPLYDNITPNDSGGYLFDVSAGEALNCWAIEILFNLRGSVSATFDTLYQTFNGDNTGTNYRYTYVSGDGSAAASSNANTQTAGFIPAGTAPTGSFGSGRIWIPHFRDTNFEKQAHLTMEYRIVTIVNTLALTQKWLKTPIEAITDIRLRPDGYATDTFNSNSRVVVRGWKL